MATTISPFNWYSAGVRNIVVSTLTSTDIKVALLTSTYVPNFTTHEFYDVSITNELPTANGYTTGGLSLTSKALTIGATDGEWHFTSANPTWTAAGSSIVARSFVLYNNAPSTNKPLIGFGYLDYNNGIPQDVTTAATFALSIIVPSTGWFYTQKVNG